MRISKVNMLIEMLLSLWTVFLEAFWKQLYTGFNTHTPTHTHMHTHTDLAREAEVSGSDGEVQLAKTREWRYAKHLNYHLLNCEWRPWISETQGQFSLY